MKTSLNLDDEVFSDAKKEALRRGVTVSEIISEWARAGREHLAHSRRKKKEFKPVDLGAAQIDLSNRRNWMEALENDGD